MEDPDRFVADAVPSHGEFAPVLPAVPPAFDVPSASDTATPPILAGAPAPYHGGPRTAQGKAITRCNALKHGLTATALLPEVLDPTRFDERLAAFTEEYRPQTPTEQALVRRIAYHTMALLRGEEIENALLRLGAAAPQVCLQELGEGMPAEGVLTAEEIALAAAADSEQLDRITRYSTYHEKALDTAIEKLEKRQLRRTTDTAKRADAPAAVAGPPAGAAQFPDEEACTDYLSAWARAQPFCCPECGHGEARWLAAQRRRQCTACGHQAAVRRGTVMAKSRTSLLPWFRAIEYLLRRPNASTPEVAAAAGIGRRETARQVAQKIREALASPEATDRLAGLDTVFGRPAESDPAPLLVHQASGKGSLCETIRPAPVATDLPGSH